MKKHQFYVKNCIFSLTFVIIVFALQLCIKPLHFHTTAHYSSSHTSHVQSEKQVSCLLHFSSSLPSAFSLVLLCMLAHLPLLIPFFIAFLLPILILCSHQASPQC